MHFSYEYITININAHTMIFYIVVITLQCAQRAERKMHELEKSKPATVCAL